MPPGKEAFGLTFEASVTIPATLPLDALMPPGNAQFGLTFEASITVPATFLIPAGRESSGCEEMR